MSLKNAPYLTDISSSFDGPHLGVDEGTTDPYLPTVLPSVRFDHSHKWNMKITGPAREFDLGKQSYFNGLLNKMKGKMSLTNPEIHVVWRGQVPPNICRDDVVISCRFTPKRDEKRGLMALHTHGMHLYMHHVFYPGHSISVGPGEILPWAIGFSIPEYQLDPNYEVAQVHVRLTGYFAQIPEYSSNRDSEMISIVPLDEPVTGFVTSAPRVPNSEWLMRGFKLGLEGKSLAKKVKFLQEMNINIEALSMVGELRNTLKVISSDSIKDNCDEKLKIDTAVAVNQHLKSIKK